MKIHLNRAGQSLGQFTPDEVRSGFKDGKFTATDLAWRDGMPMWKPLGEVIDEIAPDEFDSGSDAPPATVSPVVTGFPWEQRAEIGFLSALFQTVQGVLFEPTKTFQAMRPAGGYGAPLFFAVLLGSPAFLAPFFYQVFFHSLGLWVADDQSKALLEMLITSPTSIGVMVVLTPVLIAAAAFLAAGILHFFLIVLGGAKKKFEATFRVVCYSGGATAIVHLLPACGAWFGFVWALIAAIIGLSVVQGIGKGRAAAAVLLPFISCCGIMIGVLVKAYTAALAALSSVQ